MSLRLQKLVWEKSRHKGTKLIILLAIADHISDDDGLGWPGYERLARLGRVDLRAAKRIVAELVDSGELVIAERGGGRYSNKYRINEDVLNGNTSGQDTTGGEAVTAGVVSASPQGWSGGHPNHNRTATEPPTTAARPPDGGGFPSERQKPGRKSRPAPPPDTGLTEGQRYFLGSWTAKRFKTPIQRQTVADLEAQYGLERLRGAVDWAAKRGLALGEAVVAVESALKKHNGAAPNGAKRIKIDPLATQPKR